MGAKISYLVLAYRDPKLLRQLIGWLSLGSNHIFVHIDKRSEISRFETQEPQKAVFIRSRHECPWGTWGRIGASIDLLKVALETDATHFCLLSEDTFPLWDPEQINAMLDDSDLAVKMDFEKMGGPTKPLSRISSINRFEGDPRLIGPLRKILKRAPGAAKRVDWKLQLEGMIPYAGDSWWLITRKAAEEIIKFSQTEKEKMEFFQGTWIADEHFFQTVLGNSENHYTFAQSPVYADWNPQRSKFLPCFLDPSDFDNLRVQKNTYLFARKLRDSDSELAHMIPRLWV